MQNLWQIRNQLFTVFYIKDFFFLQYWLKLQKLYLPWLLGETVALLIVYDRANGENK